MSASLVLDAYDNTSGYEAALALLLPAPRHDMGAPVLVIVIGGVLSAGCVAGGSDTPWVTAPDATMVREHSGALGKALVVCVYERRKQALRGYELVWPQIVLARGHRGDASEQEEIAQLCTTAAALAACQDSEDWKSLPDYQARLGNATCMDIVASVDVRRDDSWSAALAPRKELSQ